MTTLDDSRASLQQLTDELAVARAAALARSGDHAGALAALAAAPGPPTAGRLDLTARIHAQRGAYDAADDAWRRAAELGGEDAFRAERDRVAAERSGRSRTGPGRRLWPLLTALLAVALAATITLLVVRREPSGGQDLGALLTDVRAQQSDLMRDLDELRADQQVRPSVQGVLAPVEADLTRPPGFLVRADTAALVVAFSDSPFGGEGARLSPDGDTALGELGRRLAPHTDRITVRVIGHADDTPTRPGGAYADNESLAFARALAAARRLADATGRPLESFAVATAGTDRAPFPNSDAQSRSANRTVTVEIMPGPPAAG